MVVTSMSVPPPPCGGAAAVVSCCSGRSAPPGRLSKSESWAGPSGSAGVGGGVGGRGGQRCSAAAAAVAVALAASAASTSTIKTAVAGGEDYSVATPPATVGGGDCGLLLLRRVHSVEAVTGVQSCAAVATSIQGALPSSPSAAAGSVGTPPLTETAVAASLSTRAEPSTVVLATAGTGGTSGGTVDSIRLRCCESLLHHPPAALQAGQTERKSCCGCNSMCRTSSRDRVDGSRNNIKPDLGMRTSCPDFFPFFLPSSERGCSSKEKTVSRLLAVAAAAATNAIDSSTCGSACVSTDDEPAGSSSRREVDAARKCHGASLTRACSTEKQIHLTAAAATPAVAAAAPAAGVEEEEEEYVRTTAAAAVHVESAASAADPVGGSYSAAAGVTDGTACVPVQPKTQEPLSSRPLPAGPHSSCVSNDIHYNTEDDVSNAIAPGLASQGTAVKVVVLSSIPSTRAAAERAPSACSTLAGAAKGAVLAANERMEASLAAEEANALQPKAGDLTGRVGISEVNDAKGIAPVREGERADGGPAAFLSELNAAQLFPSPQPPSLPQLLQLPDVYEAAVLALQVLPERYRQRIQQLDALEKVLPCVYTRCSYLARVRQMYVNSAELTFSQQQSLLQQLQQERSTRQCSSRSRAELHSNEQQRSKRKEEGVLEEVMDEDEDSSGCWSADPEQNKALHAVADLFKTVKTVQTRVGPTLLAGAAQLTDVLQLCEQQLDGGESRDDGNSSSGVQRPARSGFCLGKNISCSSSATNYNGGASSSSGPCDLNRSSLHHTNGSSGNEEDGRDNSREEKASSAPGRSSSGERGPFVTQLHGGVQELVDNFLHSFFSCRVAAELQREHFLLAMQNGDCGAILSSGLPMEKLIFQAALDAQELALHHLGIAAPVEVWVGEAGQADQQLRAFLLKASLHEGPVAAAWSACSSPQSGAVAEADAANALRPGDETSTPLSAAAVCTGDAVNFATRRSTPTGDGYLSCVGQQQLPRPQEKQQGWTGTRAEGREGGRAEGTGGGIGGRDSSRCSGCLSSSFAAAAATSPGWTGRCGRDTTHSSFVFTRHTSRSRSASMLPGTVRFPCFPSYAYSGIFELLKNSMRASIEAWRLNRTVTRNGRTSSNGCIGGSSRVGSCNGTRSSSAPDASSSSYYSNESGDEEQQQWRLLTVKRSRKLKKLPGRVRLQRCCFASAAPRFWVMACDADLAAAADEEREARSRSREKSETRLPGVEPRIQTEQAEHMSADEQELCCEVVQLEDGVLPPIKVLLSFVDESLVIRIEDQGEGLRQSELQNVWSFAYTTAAGKGLLQRLAAAGEETDGENAAGGARLKRMECSSSSSAAAAPAVPPLAGCGVGLPMSRVHAQSLGGDIFLESAEGKGTCAYMCLSNLEGFGNRLCQQHRSRLGRNV